MELLRVEHLSKIYGAGENQVKALDDVSLCVEKGEFVAIVGASGSGKSTLLHLLGGVDRPTSGKVYINGTDIFAMNDDELAIFRRRQVGIIYQFYNLIPILNVEENMAIPMELDGRKVEKAQMDDMLLRLGLTERRTHLPNELSGGQQQRTSIGRALITRPSIVLADEPTGNLDTKASNEIMHLLKTSNRELNQTTIILADEPTGNLDSKSSDEIVALLKKSNKELNQTIIMITHNMELAKAADRTIMIEDGKIR